MATETDRTALTLPSLLHDGVMIAGILFAWGMLAVIGVGIANLGGASGYLVALGDALRWLFIVVGLANALVYVIARGLELSRR